MRVYWKLPTPGLLHHLINRLTDWLADKIYLTIGSGGGGLVVSLLPFFSDDPSSNPSEVYNIFNQNLHESNTLMIKRPEMAHFKRSPPDAANLPDTMTRLPWLSTIFFLFLSLFNNFLCNRWRRRRLHIFCFIAFFIPLNYDPILMG